MTKLNIEVNDDEKINSPTAHEQSHSRYKQSKHAEIINIESNGSKATPSMMSRDNLEQLPSAISRNNNKHGSEFLGRR